MPPKGWRKKPIPEAIPTKGVKRSLRGGTSQTVQAKSSKKNEQVDKKKAIIHQGVVWNKLDCAPQLYLSKDALTAWGEKGFRMVRANVGVREGCWYYECEILPSQGHVRLGWGAITGELEAPVGYDSWSYGFRDVNGARIHRSERYDGYGSSFGPGDVVGCAIYLQDESSNNAYSSSFGVQDSSSGDNKTFIKFFVNGVDQGVAFSGIAPRAYYPAVSLYGGGRVRANFGPSWIFPPDDSLSTENDATTSLRSLSELKPPITKQDSAIRAKEVLQRRHELTSNSKIDTEVESIPTKEFPTADSSGI